MSTILLISPFEDPPVNNYKKYRQNIVYEILRQKNDVTWLGTDFDHSTKTKRVYDKNIAGIYIVPMIAYGSSVSIRRFFSYFIFSLRAACKVVTSGKRYDLIICWGPVELVFLVSIYSKLRNTKCIIDVIDTWPDLFIQYFHGYFRVLAKILLAPYYLMSMISLNCASHVTSVSRTYTEWAMKRGHRNDFENSSYFYLGSSSDSIGFNAHKDRTTLRCLFAGQFGHSYDLETIVAVARRLHNEGNARIHIILAGGGYKNDALRTMTEGLTNIEFTGWLDSSMLATLATDCHVGLCSYTDRATQSIPTKVFDYMAFGLCIVNSLKGELANFITDNEIGFEYDSQNENSLHDLLVKLSHSIENVIHRGENAYKLFTGKYNSNVIYNAMVTDVISKYL